MTARFSIEIDGQSYFIVPGTFVEGAVRRQAEFQQLQEEDLHSRPDVREFMQTSWLGGSQWEKPIYSSSNRNTYFDATDLSLTDTAGAVQQSATVQAISGVLDAPSTALCAWTKNSIHGAVALAWSGGAFNWYKWDAASNAFTSVSLAYSTASNAFDASDEIFAVSGGAGDLVYVLMKSGWLGYWDTTGTTVTRVNLSISVYNGTSMWVDADYVWIYNGDLLYRCPIASSYTPEIINDDDDGPDAFSAGTSFVNKPIIPEWSNRRAIRTAEGIFYIKNVLQGGLVLCKVHRVDRDASGSYIDTPVTTLAPGTVGLELGYHLSSLLISTVSNYYDVINNADDQRVTIYHVTGTSVGAIGSPLGGDNLDETPVWMLGTIGEQFLFGGRKRIWQYDPRVGAFHPWYSASGTKYSDHGGGWSGMASVKLTSGSGLLFKHSSQDGLLNDPYLLTANLSTSTNTSTKTSFITSNWFDFDLPMEQKSVTEVYWDSAFVRTGSTVNIQLSVDGGAFSTILTITGGTTDDTGRASITPVKGYKFQYNLIFNDDTDVTSLDPGRVLAVGFSAVAGEMVEVMQFTIDGNESMGINNAIQVPEAVYNNMATLRANDDTFTVKHYYKSHDGSKSVTKTMRLASVTGSKAWPGEGKYDVVLMEI